MKQKRQSIIPVHRMDVQSPLGIEFSYMELMDDYVEIRMESRKSEIHRDDYYIFLFLETGNAVFTVDFRETGCEDGTVFYIRPGQVHFISSIRDVKGWFLAIDAMLVENDYKNLFEWIFPTQKPIRLNRDVMTRMNKTAYLLDSAMQTPSTVFSNAIISSLANVFIGIIAEQYSKDENLERNKSRSALITYQFKKMLSENFKTIKSPSEYAKRLNYSLSHLNKSVKSVTGFPVSYWIHQQVILEAKRLLYYTNLDVKEIAFVLGYEDHTYFSRLFSKTIGMSAIALRLKFHE
ncbi:MAG: AraC family transcriptional regulator [Tannerellaceae bacterium]|nr:AraC family transcriptional regulator [Tannerellaceae bacterium]